MQPWAGEVIEFWFGLRPQQWWNADAELDESCRERFVDLWQEQRQQPGSTFLHSPEEALAAIILFDQFPRNMFRGHADRFATDHLVLAIAKAALDRGFDEALVQPRRGFLYMPFQHSEDLDDQQRSVALFTALADSEQLHFARLHHEVIERFGRFPHRNLILGRSPRAAELAAGYVVPW